MELKYAVEGFQWDSCYTKMVKTYCFSVRSLHIMLQKKSGFFFFYQILFKEGNNIGITSKLDKIINIIALQI